MGEEQYLAPLDETLQRLAALLGRQTEGSIDPGADATLDSPSFFRTPLGVAVIAIVGAGTAYALYSAQHDRIHSATR